MENIKRALLVLSLFFISCTEDPPTTIPIDPGPGQKHILYANLVKLEIVQLKKTLVCVNMAHNIV